MDEDRAIGLEHEHTGSPGQVGVQATGVVDGAGGNNETHPSTLAGQTEARRDAGAGRPEHRVTSLPLRRHPSTAPAPDQGLFLRRDPGPGPSYQEATTLAVDKQPHD